MKYIKEFLELASHLEVYILQQKRIEKLKRIQKVMEQNLRQEKLEKINRSNEY